ncbi:SET_domain-containing protein [Hexamita inflata]|uniref:SET domain-containing protein n=1 Tax=Hexamita inflata TaxID=28002 RepID=A0AA86NSD4_9EUKA|nr:SET domain-containing protein [Hexamita inflata]
MKQNITALNKLLDPTPIVASYSRQAPDTVGLYLHTNIAPKSEPLVIERPLICWSLDQPTNQCANCFCKVDKIVTCRVDGCQDIFCSQRCEEELFQSLSYAKCRPGVYEQFAELRKYKSGNFDGVTIFKLYTLLISRFFEFIIESSDEKQALLKAMQPLALLKPQQPIKHDFNIPFDKLTAQIQQILGPFQRLFSYLYPDKYTEFKFPALEVFFRRDFCKFLCEICTFCSIKISENAFGLFKICSILNHSCCPNCETKFFNGALRLFLTGEIQETDELVINYCCDIQNYTERQKYLQDQLGFSCQCQKCLHQE